MVKKIRKNKIGKASLYAMLFTVLLINEGSLAVSEGKKSTAVKSADNQVVARPHWDFTDDVKNIQLGRDSKGAYVDITISPILRAYEERPQNDAQDMQVQEAVSYLRSRKPGNFVYVVSINELRPHAAFKGTIENGTAPDIVRVRLVNDSFEDARYKRLQNFITARTQNPQTHSMFRVLNYEPTSVTEAGIPTKDRVDYIFFSQKGFSLQKGEAGKPYKAIFKGVKFATLLPANGDDETEMSVPEFMKSWDSGGKSSFASESPNGDWEFYDDKGNVQGFRMKFSNPVYDAAKEEISFDVTPLVDPKTNKLLMPGLLEDGEMIEINSPLKLYLDFGWMGSGK